ncbi:MAG: 6-bladed beta-propeller [Gammaproteobacteria bacterium]|nr:6-bladed beta-propeller [Gammaproteobacteria bacterium]
MVINTIKFLLLVSTLLSVLMGCATTPDKLLFSMPSSTQAQPEQQMIWPDPPQTPRYQYIGDLRGESNLVKDEKKKGSLISRFFSALVGLDNESIPLVDLIRPQQGTIDRQGRIYVADPGKQAVYVFDEKVSEFFIWNEDTLNIPFKSPVGIVSTDDSILVTDSEQGLVYILNLQGQLQNTLGSGILKRPTGIAFDPIQQRVFISDTSEDNIKIFDLQGKLLSTIGSRGAQPGEFNRPTFLQFHKNKLYIADSLNTRVQVINQQNGNIQVIGERGLYIGNFSRPKGIAIDSDDNIYVTESYYDYVLIYNAEGEFLMSIGGSGDQPGEFSQPTGVWIDQQDRLFVSDMLNSRVSIFQYLGGQ